MLNKLQAEQAKRKKDGGFTIIEVMIVLAIVGLIMLIVFLAVPALQRNSRNTQRKSEASALGSAYSEYVNNHGGKVPTDAYDVYNNAKLNFYEPANVKIEAVTTGANIATAAPDTDGVLILTHAKCDATKDFKADKSGSVSYSSRGGVIVFTTEGSSDTTTCISAG